MIHAPRNSIDFNDLDFKRFVDPITSGKTVYIIYLRNVRNVSSTVSSGIRKNLSEKSLILSFSGFSSLFAFLSRVLCLRLLANFEVCSIYVDFRDFSSDQPPLGRLNMILVLV